MLTLAKQFGLQMDRVVDTVELTKAAFDLASRDMTRLRSAHAVVSAAKVVHSKAKQVGNPSVSYDGAFLIACAQFESSVRELVERFIERLTTRVSVYQHIPETIKAWHTKGCAQLLLTDRIPRDVVLANLASCIRPSQRRPYRLMPEAFSYSDRNFKAEIVDSMMKERIGLDKVWQKLSRDANVQLYLGTKEQATAERLLREKVNTYITRRNDIIHRGKQYYTAGESEVVECARFFKMVVQATAEHLEAFLTTF